MKTVVCDICGKHEGNLVKSLAQIHRYTRTSGKWWQSARTIEDQFDICDVCLQRIRNEIKEGGEANETD